MTAPITPRQAAVHLHKLGANITAIPAGGKRPAHEWNNPSAPWASQRQPRGYIDKLDWTTEPHLGRGGKLYQPIETVGVICGIGGWRWIDVDAIKLADGTRLLVPESVRIALLDALGLPHDYAWCGRSKSGYGWHIVFRCDSPLPDAIAAAVADTKAGEGGGAGVKIGVPLTAYADVFDHIELRWENCQTTLPTPTGYNGHLPSTAPANVSIDQVATAFLAVAAPKPHKSITRPPPTPSRTHTNAPRTHLVWDEATRDALRNHFDLVAWFCQELGGDTQDEPGGETRILGHTGLLVNADTASWYCHGAGVGGDWADAIAYTRYGGHMPTEGAFFDLVRIAADFAGVPLREAPRAARPSTSPSPTTSDLTPDQIALLNALNRTDTGNAEVLALLSGDTLRYCASRKKWLVWTGSRWRIDEIGHAYRILTTVVRQRYRAATAIDDLEVRKKAAAWAIMSENNTKLEAALKCASRIDPFATTIAQYDADPFLAATPTATLDLRTGAARAPERDDYLTMTLGTTYNPAATCPRWLRFLNEVFANDADLIDYIQRAIGYGLTGDISEQKVFLCHGAGANGKSTFLEVLTWLMGDYSGNASFDTFDAGRRSDATNDLAALKGRRFVTVIETEEDRRLAEARVKAVTGGDLLTCRFLYGEFFSYRPQFKIWLAMNHKPIIRGTDRGIWRRLQLIPFTQNFEGKEDRSLRDTLRAELPGILNWALEGLRAWQANGLGTCAAVRAATQAYQEESDQVGRWMGDHTIVGGQFTVQAASAYADYVRWCEANGEHAFSQTMWGRRLTERGITRMRSRGAWQLIGFGLVARPSDAALPVGDDGEPQSDTNMEKPMPETGHGEDTPAIALAPNAATPPSGAPVAPDSIPTTAAAPPALELLDAPACT